MRIAALDLGSNSFHLLAVEAHLDGTFTTLVREKEMLRLGDLVSRDGAIPPAAADRAVEVVKRLRALAEGVGCTEIVASATSAIREAENGAAVVDRLRREAGVDVRVISGRDEARTIFAAVRGSVVIDPGPAVCFDLGGGSLEIMVGDAGGLLWSTSLKLGVARLSAELVRDDPPSADDQRRLRERLTKALAPIAETVAELEPKMAIGTSGTICDLVRAAAGARLDTIPRSVNQLSVDATELVELHERLVTMTAEQRAKIPGVEPRRADLLPAGSMVVTTALELFGLDTITVSEWALREGMVIEAIGRHDAADWSDDPRAIRRSSVLGLARRCNWHEGHARQVSRLATELFDKTVELHDLAENDRELLEHAALLHDIGEHVSTTSHHKHTAYLIEHGQLRGFDFEEVQALACVARYHRNSEPKPSHEPFASLSADRQRRVTILAALLRLADGLDRGYTSSVDRVDLSITEDLVRIEVSGRSDVELELWGARRKRGAFERVFDHKVEVVGRV